MRPKGLHKTATRYLATRCTPESNRSTREMFVDQIDYLRELNLELSGFISSLHW
jgi:hypothetical protein